MPAASSSTIVPVIDHLVAVADSLVDDRPGLLGVLCRVGDPRDRRGVRHSLRCVLVLAACAVLAGARSYAAIAEWAADADEQTLTEAGATWGVSSESTFRRTRQRLDGDVLDRLLGGWAQTRTGRAGCGVLPSTAGPSAVRRAGSPPGQ